MYILYLLFQVDVQVKRVRDREKVKCKFNLWHLCCGEWTLRFALFSLNLIIQLQNENIFPFPTLFVKSNNFSVYLMGFNQRKVARILTFCEAKQTKSIFSNVDEERSFMMITNLVLIWRSTEIRMKNDELSIDRIIFYMNLWMVFI